MKKYTLRYLDNFSDDEINSVCVIAESEADARDWFFKYKSGFLLETKFVCWI